MLHSCTNSQEAQSASAIASRARREVFLGSPTENGYYGKWDYMNDRYASIFRFLEVAALTPKRMNDDLVQFWFKEEQYYIRFLEQKKAVRLFHPRIWQVESHLEFGISTFVSNDMNDDAFGIKMFVNGTENYVYAAADLFVTDIEAFKNTFFDYMNAMNWAVVEFRKRTDEAMEDEENPAPHDPRS